MCKKGQLYKYISIQNISKSVLTQEISINMRTQCIFKRIAITFEI